MSHLQGAFPAGGGELHRIGGPGRKVVGVGGLDLAEAHPLPDPEMAFPQIRDHGRPHPGMGGRDQFGAALGPPQGRRVNRRQPAIVFRCRGQIMDIVEITVALGRDQRRQMLPHPARRPLHLFVAAGRHRHIDAALVAGNFRPFGFAVADQVEGGDHQRCCSLITASISSWIRPLEATISARKGE